jgi:hypothetical protein
MPVSKKRKKSPKSARPQTKRFLLPMPRDEADRLSLQSRVALEAVRSQRAGVQETTVIAQTVLLASFLTEAGHGLLDLDDVRKTERSVLKVLDVGTEPGEWVFNDALIDALTSIVNEHDRQLREVRFGEVFEATTRLDRMVTAAHRTS